jgi:SWI/SNF-related matrix-associated actin-dependent regulator of chromatin subfamily A3
MVQVDSKLLAKSTSQTNNLQTNNFYAFKVKERSNDELSLEFTEGTILGNLTKHLSEVLAHLLKHWTVQLDALAHIITLRETISRAAKASQAIAHVDIIICGSSADSSKIGGYLSSKKVFLQRPDQQLPNVKYDNPQKIMFPGLEISKDTTKEIYANIDPVQEGQEILQKAISDVYASLKRGARLNRIEGDERLKTRLLP